MGPTDADLVQEQLREREPPAPEAPARQASPLTRLAAAVGNRGMQTISRMRHGEGILPGGTVHPDVEAAIAASRGRGSPLPRRLADQFASAFGGPVDDVRLHTDSTADALARSVSARAFATGQDIFFGKGEFRPGTPSGDELIAHEVAHTEQQRGAPVAGPLTVSQPGDALERDADNVARGLVG